MNGRKIAFLLPSLGAGGAQRVIVNLANHFARQGLAVDLVLLKAAGVHFASLDRRINVVDLRCARTVLALLPLIGYLKGARPAALLVTMPHISVVAVAAKWLSGAACRLVIRQPNYLSLNSGAVNPFTPWLLKTICWFFAKADRIVAISEGVAADLVRCGINDADKIVTIYNPIFETAILSRAEQKVDHRWFAETDRDYALIVAAGRLVKQKNFPLLIDAFERLLRRKNARLVILGEGRLRETLQAEIDALQLRDKVDMPGFCDNPYAYLRQADLFVLSSSWEGFGNVLVEALAVGTPVVSTDCPSGPAEILQNGNYGLLVENNNSAALAEGMFKALEQPRRKDLLQQRARDFAIDPIAARYLRILMPA
ncbi:MAG: glycosyltransferase [Gammaproteobacteria bacterium]